MDLKDLRAVLGKSDIGLLRSIRPNDCVFEGEWGDSLKVTPLGLAFTFWPSFGQSPYLETESDLGLIGLACPYRPRRLRTSVL